MNTCIICGCEIDAFEICDDCAEEMETEQIDPYDENPYEEYDLEYDG